jgi:hypothetical protein
LGRPNHDSAPNYSAYLIGHYVNYSDVDEPIAYSTYRAYEFSATVSGNQITIEDRTNAAPYEMVAGVSYGPHFTEIDSAVAPVINGIDQDLILSWYKEASNGEYPDFKFAIAPVRNEKFLDNSLNPEYAKYQNNIDRNGDIIANLSSAGNKNKNVFTCFPYNNYILESIFKMNNLSLFGGILNNTELSTICIWNNLSNDIVLVDSDTLVQLRIPSPYIDLNQNIKGTSIKDFLYANRKTFGIDFIYRSNGAVECVFKKDIALSTEADDWSKKEIPDAEIYVEDDVNGFTFKPASNPDSYYSSQIKDTEEYQTKEDVATIGDLLDILDDPINTIRGVLPAVADIYTLLYRCTFKSDFTKTWVYFGKRMKSKTEGDGNVNIQSEIGSPLMYYIDEAATDRPRWRIPRVDQEGRSLFSYETQTDPSGLKFMFYRGLRTMQWRNSDASYDYVSTPYLSTICQSPLSQVASDDFSLNIIGEKTASYDYEEYGLYARLWKDWCEMILNARKVKKKWLLTPQDLLQLDLSKKKYANGKTYLIEKIDCELGTSETILATAYCWRL